MDLQHLLLLLITTSLLNLIQNPVVACRSPTPSPSQSQAPSRTPHDGKKDFIKKSCQSTTYPDVCYKALSSYASKVRNDPVKLALASISYTLPRAQAMRDYTDKLNHTKLDPNIASPIDQCVEMYEDVVYEIIMTLDEMKKKKYNIDDLNTWLSAAITDEETCAEGFEDDMDGVSSDGSDVKSDVLGRNWEVRMLTSISLDLVVLSGQK